MKVKCIALPGKERRSSDGWIAIGKEYEVLSVYADPFQGVLLRLVGEDKFTPALFSGDLFEVTDHVIPSNWVLVKDEQGVFRLSPRAWLESGFWERFFDRDPTAVSIFEKEKG